MGGRSTLYYQYKLVLLVLMFLLPRCERTESNFGAAAGENRPAFYNNGDDDDEDCTIAITPDFLITDSLIMGDEHLDTIPKNESDEFIKSSVKDLVPNPNLDSTPKNDRFDTESYLLESLLNRDTLMASSLKIDSLFAEFASELIFLNSIPSGIAEANCDPVEDIHLVERVLYNNSSPHPPKEFVSENSNADIESFSPSPIPDDDYDSESDILILNELPSNDTLSLPENESFHFDIPSFSRHPAKPPDGNTGILNTKMMGDVYKQKVPMPRLMITLVSNKEKSPDLLSHRGLKIFQPSAKCPMMIHGKNIPILDVPLFHFYPLDQFNIPGNLKTLAKGFCPPSLHFLSFNWETSSGPAWLFDIDSLSQTMNNHPVLAENQTNSNAGFQDLEKAREEGTQTYVLFLVLSDECINNSSNGVSAAGPSVSAAGLDFTNNTNDFTAADPLVFAAELNFTNSTNDFSAAGPSNAAMPNLEDLSHNANDVGAEADTNNMESIISVSPIPTTRIHKDHPTSEIIGDLSSTTQTRSMARGVRDQGGI
nr:hypothetical protein [Tanacetum cinerariifolium]